MGDYFDKKVILASSSPRRKLLLSKLFDDFTVETPIVQEVEMPTPELTAIDNAVLKGKSIRTHCDILIASDTVVALNGKIYGKPKTEEDAIAMLGELNGVAHKVFTGVYLRIEGKEIAFVESSEVWLKDLSEGDIIGYVKNYTPMDKAGGYGIQDSVVVDRYEGDYDNIVGLPVNKIAQYLGDFYDKN